MHIRIHVLAITMMSLATVSVSKAELPKPSSELLGGSLDKLSFDPSQSDEFGGAQVDTTKWNINTEDWGTWSWEPENAFTKEGSLNLRMVQENHKRGNQELFYKSGIARSYNTFTYGYFEARVKSCSMYPGACPSFWLHSKGPQNRYQAKDGETVAYSEIDIVELQQCEFDNATKKHHEVNRIDCNLHASMIRDGKREWLRPNMDPARCKTAYDSPWDPRDAFHVYAVENTPETIIWYIDGKEVGRKANLYWHLPMHVTLSLGLRHPFEAYKNGSRIPVPEKTTSDGFPTSMLVDYVRVWKSSEVAPAQPASGSGGKMAGTKPGTKKRLMTKNQSRGMSKEAFIAMEKSKWETNGWPWNQAKVESNFGEMDTNQDGVATGLERQTWFKQKSASMSK